MYCLCVCNVFVRLGFYNGDNLEKYDVCEGEASMLVRESAWALRQDKTDRSRDCAVLRPGGAYRREAVAYMRQRLGPERFNQIMSSCGSFAKYPYVAAKLFLSVEDWNRYVWIEWHGSLDDYAP